MSLLYLDTLFVVYTSERYFPFSIYIEMRSSLRWSIVLCLQLASYNAALPTMNGDPIPQEPASSIALPRAGAQSATVPVTKITGGLYWWVTATVNGQDVKVMVDTGSSDL